VKPGKGTRDNAKHLGSNININKTKLQRQLCMSSYCLMGKEGTVTVWSAITRKSNLSTAPYSREDI